MIRVRKAVSKPVAFSVLAVLGAVLYFRTLDVPFYFDDSAWIVDNPAISTFPDILQPRGVSFLSFYLNLKYFGLSLPSLHATNILIHIGTAYLVFLLLSRFSSLSGFPALLGALVYLVHPVQTQAVNYTVQRMTLLSAFFTLLSCNLYLWYRNMATERPGEWIKKWGLYFLALAMGWFALQSKQNAAILPFLLILLEWGRQPEEEGTFLRGCLRILPFVLVPLYYGFVTVILKQGGGLGGLSNAEFLQKADVVTPLHYFVTEWKVLFIYLRLLLLPYRQIFDYGYPFTDTLWAWDNLFAGLGLVGLVGIGVWGLMRRSLFGIGLLWILVALSVESTFIPLDPIFEHRLYLPLVGFCILVAAVYIRFFKRPYLLVGILLLFCGLTLARNEVWRSPADLWKQDVSHGSQSYRSYFGYADALHNAGEKESAARMYEAGADLFLGSESIDQSNPKFLYNLGVVFERLEKYQRAESFYRKAVLNRPGYGLAYYGLGVSLYRQERFAKAEQAFGNAMVFLPGKPNPINARADTLIRLGRGEEARLLAERLKTVSPNQYRELMEELRQRDP